MELLYRERDHIKLFVQTQFPETEEILTQLIREISTDKTLILIVKDTRPILAFLKCRTLQIRPKFQE